MTRWLGFKSLAWCSLDCTVVRSDKETICPFLWRRTFAALKGNCLHVSTLNVTLCFYSLSANVIQQRQTFYWAWSQMMHSWKPFSNVRKHTTKAQWWKCSPTQSKRDVWPSWRCSCITGPPLSDMRLSGWLIGNPLLEETVSHVLHPLICLSNSLSCADSLFCLALYKFQMPLFKGWRVIVQKGTL